MACDQYRWLSEEKNDKKRDSKTNTYQNMSGKE